MKYFFIISFMIFITSDTLASRVRHVAGENTSKYCPYKIETSIFANTRADEGVDSQNSGRKGRLESRVKEK